MINFKLLKFQNFSRFAISDIYCMMPDILVISIKFRIRVIKWIPFSVFVILPKSTISEKCSLGLTTVVWIPTFEKSRAWFQKTPLYEVLCLTRCSKQDDERFKQSENPNDARWIEWDNYFNCQRNSKPWDDGVAFEINYNHLILFILLH